MEDTSNMSPKQFHKYRMQKSYNMRKTAMKSKDVRKTLDKWERQGFQIERFSNGKEHVAKISSPSTGMLLDIAYTVGKDEFDDKETHVWATTR